MKKVLAIMLVCFMLVSLLPMGALAEEIEQVKCPYEGANHYKSNCEYTFVAAVKGQCGEYDYNVYSCNACGDYFAADFVKIDGSHDFVEITAATHSKPGKQECSICGKVEETKCDGELGDFVGNCKDGWTASCLKCGEVVEKLPGQHTWGEMPSKIVKEPNEATNENGLAEYTCTVCGEVKEVVILSHLCADEIEAVEAQDPTCTVDGTLAHDKCAVCGKTFIDGIEVSASGLVIPATGHVKGEAQEVSKEMTVAYWTVYTAVTPNSNITVEFSAALTRGYIMIQMYDAEWENYYALDNGYLYDGDTATIEFVAGEKYRIYSWGEGTLTYSYLEGPVTIEGDCINETVCRFKCVVCGEYAEEKLGLNHKFAVEYYTAPTCETYGYKIESCVACGEHRIERLDPLGHTARPADEDLPIEYDRWGDVSRENPVLPNCVEDGYYWWLCETCGKEQREVIKSTGCELITITVPATCNQYAYSYTICAKTLEYATKYDCPTYNYSTQVNEITNGDYSIALGGYYNLLDSNIDIAAGFDKNNHNATDKAKGEVIEPTCEEDGLIIYWCTDCEAGIVETLPALGHEWNEELIVSEPTCGQIGYIAHTCDVCYKMEVLEWIEFTSEYIYLTYESAAECHNLENSIKEVFRPGICGEQAALDRYLCLTCMQYILVKDDSFENHVMPEDLLEKDDPNNQVETPVFESTVMTGTLTEASGGYIEIYIPFVMPCDGKVTIEKVVTDVDYYVSGIYETYEYEAGDVLNVNIWISASKADAFTYNVTITPYALNVAEQEFCAKDATCTEDGYTAQYYCERCGELQKSEAIKAGGHVEIVDVEAKKATCTENGCTKGWHCDVCDYTVESEVIAALGHTSILVDSAEWKENEQFGYEHYMCTTCNYEYIINYVGVCIHDWNTRADRDLSKDATCTEAGYKAYKCKNCDAVKYEEIARKHHTNAAGQDLEFCGTETKDNLCTICNKEFTVPAHTMDEGVYYPANCLSNAYWMFTCEVCDHYEVEEIKDSTGAHGWGIWAPVYDDNGVIVEEARGCAYCGKVERRAITCIAYAATIENAANAAGKVTDGSLIKVTISVSGSEDNAWGFHLNIPYSENMTFVEAKFVSTSFTYAQVATNHDGYVTILANANGDVVLNGKENIVELYFTVTAPEITNVAVAIENVDTLTADGKSVPAVAYGAEAKTVLLMELDGVEGITLADALALYNLIVANKYDAAADLDKDGVVTLADYLYLFNFLSGAIDYEDVVALN